MTAHLPPPTIEDAIRLALDAHADQYQKNGAPYILHPLTLMTRMPPGDETAQIVAVLHDVIEDTPVTLNELRAKGYNETILTALDALTRRNGETYEAFIQRAAANPLARRVKIADVEHNLDVRRLPSVTADDIIRLERYRAAWRVLTR